MLCFSHDLFHLSLPYSTSLLLDIGLPLLFQKRLRQGCHFYLLYQLFLSQVSLSLSPPSFLVPVKTKKNCSCFITYQLALKHCCVVLISVQTSNVPKAFPYFYRHNSAVLLVCLTRKQSSMQVTKEKLLVLILKYLAEQLPC